MATVCVKTKDGSYNINVGRKILSDAGKLWNLDRKVLVVTDSGVPSKYSDAVAAQCKNAVRVCVGAGESSKCFDNLERLCRIMLDNSFTRTDAVIAVGGGVVGDLSGFAASCYMRGIDFYNVPTTLLSQSDSSIGGKTAVNLGAVKNIVGAFYQPKGVLIDCDVLKTLPKRQFNSGLAEIIKMAATFNSTLFQKIEDGRICNELDDIIVEALNIKKNVVEKDERESGIRRVLNFGHTIGHGIESCSGLGGLYHGECVALGMLPMCSEEVRKRLLKIYRSVGLPTELDCDADGVISALVHDKKLDGDVINVVYVHEIGSYEIRTEKISEFTQKVRKAFSK